ncbi:hypothetical protein [Leptospira kirschneri]|nr:hypothetical protein [Leptospira kirschneri]
MQDQILEKARALTILISSKAREDAKANGQDVLFRKGNNLICRKPNGEEIVLKQLPRRVSNLLAEYDLE